MRIERGQINVKDGLIFTNGVFLVTITKSCAPIINYWCPTNSPLTKGVGGIDIDSQCFTIGPVLFLHEGLVIRTYIKRLIKRKMTMFSHDIKFSRTPVIINNQSFIKFCNTEIILTLFFSFAISNAVFPFVSLLFISALASIKSVVTSLQSSPCDAL